MSYGDDHFDQIINEVENRSTEELLESHSTAAMKRMPRMAKIIESATKDEMVLEAVDQCMSMAYIDRQLAEVKDWEPNAKIEREKWYEAKVALSLATFAFQADLDNGRKARYLNGRNAFNEEYSSDKRRNANHSYPPESKLGIYYAIEGGCHVLDDVRAIYAKVVNGPEQQRRRRQ